jgi:hypothetical protein
MGNLGQLDQSSVWKWTDKSIRKELKDSTTLED